MAAGGVSLGKAYITIIPTTKGARKEIAKSLSPELEAAGKEGGEKLSGGIGGALSSGASKIAGLAKALVAGAAVKSLHDFQSSVLDTYATFEQLSGGVEKIFDEMDTSAIMEDAKQAYKTLGMSANEYLDAMTNVGATFAATLGDQRGYEVAKQGLQAIADFASGTGKSVDLLTEKYTLITRSTSSYLSIADQFAGVLPATNEGFLEQAKAAGLIGQQYEKITDIPLPEYQEAVTAMIERGVGSMGLLGNTAAEAENTLSGSTAMMKSSWENLITAFGTGSKEEITRAFGDTLDATKTWALNMYDRVQIFRRGIMEALPGMWDALVERLPGILEEVRSLVKEKLSHWHEIAQTIIAQVGPFVERLGGLVVEAIQTILPKIGPVLMSAIDLVMTTVQSIDWVGLGMSVLEAIMSIDWIGLADKIINTILSLTGSIANRIANAVGSVDWAALGEEILTAIQSVDWLGIATKISDTVSGAVGGLIEFIIGPEAFSSIQEAVSQVAGPVADALAPVGEKIKEVFGDTLSQVQESLPGIIAGVQDFASKIGEFLANVPWDQVGEFLGFLVSKLVEIGGSLGSVIGDVLGGVVWPLVQELWGFLGDVLIPGLMEFIGPLAEGIGIVADILASICGWVADLIGGLVDFLQPAIEALFAFLSPLLSGLLDALASLFGTIISTIGVIWDHVKPFVDKVVEIVSGIFSAIGGWLDDNKEWINALLSWLGSTIGGFFSIVSDTIGGIFKFIGDLLGGVLDHVTLVIDGIGKVIGGIIDVVRGIFDVVVGVITGNFDKAKEGVEKIFAGFGQAVQGFADMITAPFKTAFKAIQDLWNNTLGGFEFTAPDWIPVIGGQTIGIPKLASGGDLVLGGTVMVGEEGPELLDLPRGARVRPLDSDIAETGDTYNVNVGDVNLSDDDDIRRATREYLEYLARKANSRQVQFA